MHSILVSLSRISIKTNGFTTEGRTFMFGAHAERGEGTLPRSRRVRETVEGDGCARWTLTGTHNCLRSWWRH